MVIYLHESKAWKIHISLVVLYTRLLKTPRKPRNSLIWFHGVPHTFQPHKLYWITFWGTWLRISIFEGWSGNRYQNSVHETNEKQDLSINHTLCLGHPLNEIYTSVCDYPQGSSGLVTGCACTVWCHVTGRYKTVQISGRCVLHIWAIATYLDKECYSSKR